MTADGLVVKAHTVRNIHMTEAKMLKVLNTQEAVEQQDAQEGHRDRLRCDEEDHGK